MPRFISNLFALLFGLLLCTVGNAHAQAVFEIPAFCDSLFQFGLNEKQMPGGAVAVVENNRVLFTKSYGFADWEKQSLAHPDTTLFQIGSVGKLLTVIAVLQQVDQGKLELDNDVRAYLDDFPLDQKFSSPITLRHLLTHSAGFDDRVIGYAARTKAEFQSLETHLRARMPRRFQDSGISINYSNYSYGLAGLIVEKVSRQPFTEYVRQHILAPLEMNAATYDLPTRANENPAYATGYAKRGESFEAQPLFYTQVKPAGGLSASASDMAQLLLMLLNDGAYHGQEILRRESLDLMLARQFSNHAQMRGYTLGFEEQNFGGEFAVAKGGQTLGFVSALLVFPQRKLGVFVTSNTSADDFVENFVRAFAHKYIAAQAPSVAMTDGSVALELDRFSGVYRNSRHNHHSVEDLIALFRDNARVWSVRNDTLVLFVNGVTRKYRPVAARTFQNLNDTGDYLVFRENAAGKIDGLYCSLSFAGLSVPATYEKVAWHSTPVAVNEFFLSFLPVYLMSYLLFPFLLGGILGVRLLKKDFLKSKPLPRWAHGAGMSFGALSTLYGFGYIAKLNHAGAALVFGVPESLRVLNFIPFVLVLLLLGLIYFAVKIWRERKAHLIARFYFSGFVMAGMLFAGFLYQWHFVGFRY
jgi:CubicO group peptidase (beta-lactamase class C family)